VCCSVLQYVAVCCSELQWVCYSALQCVAVCAKDTHNVRYNLKCMHRYISSHISRYMCHTISIHACLMVYIYTRIWDDIYLYTHMGWYISVHAYGMIYYGMIYIIPHLTLYVSSHPGWRRVIGCLIFIGHFPPNSPIISGSFAKKDCNLRHPMGLRHSVSIHACLMICIYTCIWDDKYLYMHFKHMYM